MTEIPHLPASAPFSAEQRAWLNGYLAGLCSVAERKTTTASAEPPVPLKPLLILYGSQTGGAERLAKNMAKEGPQHGFAPRAMEANAFGTIDLKSESRLLIVTSTWGDGDPPDNAVAFWNYLNSADAPVLKHLSFSVLALGDRNYSDFCGAGKKFDVMLEKLGAKRLQPRADCDLDYEIPAREWMSSVWAALKRIDSSPPFAAGDSVPPTTETRHGATLESAAQPAHAQGYSRQNPFPARLLVNRKLNGNGSSKDTRHIEVSLAGSGMTYEAGDALGVFPTNDPALVQAILDKLGCDGEEEVPRPDGSKTSLRRALLHDYEITRISAQVVQFASERCSSFSIAAATDSGAAKLDDYLSGRDLTDFLGEWPKFRPAAAEFVQRLRKLNPRLYSIASSAKAHSDHVHLTVGVVRFESRGRTRGGVCSTFLSDRLPENSPLPVFVQTSHGFRLPVDLATPIIMVGPGTGIAPFRGFLQERAAIGATGRNWLFFGDQRAATDFLYREELEAMLQRNVLTRLDTAFSRDQAEKIYVQQRMVEHARELWSWLQDGAHFYVCGDAKRMAKDVDAALHEVAVKGGGLTTEKAAEFVANLKSEKRYKRDVY